MSADLQSNLSGAIKLPPINQREQESKEDHEPPPEDSREEPEPVKRTVDGNPPREDEAGGEPDHPIDEEMVGSLVRFHHDCPKQFLLFCVAVAATVILAFDWSENLI